jgi:hypothetical protein
MMSNGKSTLYERPGGYDAISAVANDLLPRLRTDPQLGRFWAHRSAAVTGVITLDAETGLAPALSRKFVELHGGHGVTGARL